MGARWSELLVQFFEAHGEALGEVFDAARCREGWLQGELFRYFRFRRRFASFAVNSLWISESQRADFSAEEPTRVVGEVKLVGTNYDTKNITGGSIKPFLERIDRPITAADRSSLSLGPWGLIPDFFRLLDFAEKDDRDALLVLIVDERSKYNRSLARALRGINFVGPSRDVRFREAPMVVRLWFIPPAAAQQGTPHR